MQKSTIKISREVAAQYAQEAVEIIAKGQYLAPSGQIVSLADLVEYAVQNTQSYPPDKPLAETMTGNNTTQIEILNETTLAAAQRLAGQGFHPVALNFASATHPGGGFLAGARAQEEFLARSSGLYACIRDNSMYGFHQRRHDPLYSDYVIYSPQVPVFRDTNGRQLLDKPYTIGIITCPAANANALPPARCSEIPQAMWRRILKVLAVGVAHQHEAIVLGAWGCGAFGNDGQTIAMLFQKALQTNFAGAYRQVVFAIVDESAERKFIGPFEQVFQKK